MAFKIPKGKCVMTIWNDDNSFKCGSVLKNRQADLTVEPGQFVQVDFEAGDPMQPKAVRCEVIAWPCIKGFRFDDPADSPFTPAKVKAPKSEFKADAKADAKFGEKH